MLYSKGMEFKKIAICYNPKIQNSVEVKNELRSILAQHCIDASVIDIDTLTNGYDFVYVIGGDGTILKAARFFAKHNAAIFGINLGRLGFLSQSSKEYLKKSVEKILNGRFHIEERIMLQSFDAIALNDFVIVCPTGLLGVRDLKRKGEPAVYHGAFEVVQKPDHKGFYLVNLVEIQEYLKGVVPNEMPIRFGLEALKAQTIAARNYVLAPRTKAYEEFDVVDSVASQVYYGANTETDISTRAVIETDGVVALYDNEPILTLYSSTAGGYTESYANAFSDPNSKIFPSEHKPYLAAVPDEEEFPKLNDEDKARNFYSQKVPSFDIESPYYRWQKEWAVGELENILKKTLPAQSKTGFVTPEFKASDDLGTIKDIKVMRRGESGKAIEVELMTTKGCYRISKELVIRRVFQKDGISLPSANIIFEKNLDNYGNITDITVYGGGFGHGVGMSQYGAGYMATKLKQPYYNILRHYYTGICLGTLPVEVWNEPVKQTFWAPAGRAALVLINPGVSKIKVVINGKERMFDVTKSLFQKEVKIDISRFIEDGQNNIVYCPNDHLIKVYVELVEKYSHTTGTREKSDEQG